MVLLKPGRVGVKFQEWKDQNLIFITGAPPTWEKLVWFIVSDFALHTYKEIFKSLREQNSICSFLNTFSLSHCLAQNSSFFERHAATILTFISIQTFFFWTLFYALLCYTATKIPLRGLSPNFHILVSVSYLYIPRIGSHLSCRRIGRSIAGIYKSLADTWMWKLGLWLRNSFTGNICYEFSA
jgi:hypothetical protein